MNEQEFDQEMRYIYDNVQNLTRLASSVARSLVRLVAAQEKLVELAMVDLEGQVEAGAEGRAQEKAEQIMKDKSKRGFIGQK